MPLSQIPKHRKKVLVGPFFFSPITTAGKHSTAEGASGSRDAAAPPQVRTDAVRNGATKPMTCNQEGQLQLADAQFVAECRKVTALPAYLAGALIPVKVAVELDVNRL